MVQCDPVATSLRRIQHARYIVENARAKFVAKQSASSLSTASSSPLTSSASGRASGIHVMLLVHLPRTSDLASFTFDFDLRWRYAFLDSVESAKSTGYVYSECVIVFL